MKLTVKNFGPIREARNIDISPMTIFVGPSNTGKSYLAMLIYSIFKVITDEEFTWELAHLSRGEKKYLRKSSDKPRKSGNSTLEEIEASFIEWTHSISGAWRYQFDYCFGEEGRKMIARKDGNNGLSITISDNENQLSLNLTSPGQSILRRRKKQKIYEYVMLRFLDYIEESSGEEIAGGHDDDLLYPIRSVRSYSYAILEQFRHALLPWKPLEASIDAYYLPDIRGGIVQTYGTIISSLISRNPKEGLSMVPSSIHSLKGVIADSMLKLVNIDEERTKIIKSPHKYIKALRRSDEHDGIRDETETIEKIGANIETGILSGEIRISKPEVGIPEFYYEFTRDNKEYSIPLIRASSSVTEIAPVSLLIRKYVCPGDLFIVEEPETNLHPAAQRKISDDLVRLANAGVKVLVTTHSDNILEQVSNFIYAADLPDSKLTKLDEEKCSVYLFKPGRGGNKTTVRKIPFDPETGLVTQDHLDVSSALYNETVNLMEQRENVGKSNGMRGAIDYSPTAAIMEFPSKNN